MSNPQESSKNSVIHFEAVVAEQILQEAKELLEVIKSIVEEKIGKENEEKVHALIHDEIEKVEVAREEDRVKYTYKPNDEE